MSDISEFVKAPSEDFLNKCTKEQLLKVAEHFEIDISDRRLKDTVKSMLTANLTEMGVLAVEPGCPPDAGVSQPFIAESNFTFEQQKEVLKMQLEHDKMRQVEIEKQLAIEKLRFQTEQAKLQFQQNTLDLMKSGKSMGDGSFEVDASLSVPGSSKCFDVLGNLRLLPKFCEKDPETFFSLFERVAESRKWPDSALSLMLQCALTGRAQEAYSALSASDSQNYGLVKSAVLKAYELVPEAYRQRFRTWKKVDNQTHLEFARDLTGHFTRWCSALKVKTFDDLCDLILLEQFKNSISENIAQHISDHKVKTVNEAAALADDYVLTHRRSFGELRTHGTSFGERAGGQITVGVRPALPIDGITLILGNGVAGGRVWADAPPLLHPVVSSVPLVRKQPDEYQASFPEVFTACAVTRSMTRDTPDSISEPVKIKGEVSDSWDFSLSEVPLSASQEELKLEQRADPSLEGLFDMVLSGDEVQNNSHGYFLLKELLVRKWVPHGDDFVGDPIIQVVVPVKFRGSVLKLAHDESGHWGVKKTYNRVLRHFFWPRLKRDVVSHIKTCHTCQLTGKPNQSIKPAPLFPIPAVSQPFEHLIIDCVGPLPRSRSGAVYLLTVMCQSTRFPAAYPLRTITARSVVRAVSQFISIFGIPKVIQSDQGSNFTSKLFAQALRQLHIRHNKASAYHAQSQGALERFHQSLKSLLRSYCVQMDRDWEEGLPWLMLAARDVTQESTGFSPNDLVFGHTVRGPLTVLSDQWKEAEPPKNLIDYVNGFRHRLFAAGELAKRNLTLS
uniref:Gypsy retrotransposon integrase-like protein 1 n=1 Tax=Seriola dumerili TaxID=41447 RepID=A0A3B4TE40_SERDU